MYCNRCNFHNDDNAKFCNNCGAPLERPQDNPPPPPQGNFTPYNEPPHDASANGQPDFNYGMPYNTPYTQPQGFSRPGEYTNLIPIIAIIMGLLSMNLIALIFGIISLVKFNDYDKSRFYPNGFLDERAGRLSKTLGIAAIVIACISLVLSVISLIAGLIGFGAMGFDILSDAGGYYYY